MRHLNIGSSKKIDMDSSSSGTSDDDEMDIDEAGVVPKIKEIKKKMVSAKDLKKQKREVRRRAKLNYSKKFVKQAETIKEKMKHAIKTQHLDE